MVPAQIRVVAFAKVAAPIALLIFVSVLAAKPAQAQFINGAETFFSEAFPQARGVVPVVSKGAFALCCAYLAASAFRSVSTKTNP